MSEQQTDRRAARSLARKLFETIFDHMLGRQNMDGAPEEIFRALAGLTAVLIFSAPGIRGLKRPDEYLALFTDAMNTKMRELASACEQGGDTPDGFAGFADIDEETRQTMFQAVDDAMVDAALDEKSKSTVQ